MQRSNLFLLSLIIILAVLLAVRQSKAPTTPPPQESPIATTTTLPEPSESSPTSSESQLSKQPSLEMKSEETQSPTAPTVTKKPAAKPVVQRKATISNLPEESTTEPAKEPASEPTQPQTVPTPTTIVNTEPDNAMFAPPKHSVVLEADDTQFYPNEIITVKKGMLIEMTFKARTNVYYGGLDFRSSEFGTGPVLPGNAKTVSFTANQSFPIDVYWPQTQTKKYSINVNVVE